MKRILTCLAAALALCASSAVAAEYTLYTGGTHSHTSFSDGSLLPADAYDTARFKGHCDFWYVTDHYQSLSTVETDPAVSDFIMEWDYTKRVAAEKTVAGEFLALAGWEWSDGTFGHANVLFDSTEPPGIIMTGYYDTFVSNWLRRNKQTLTGFNHPLWSEVDASLNNFRQFAFRPEIARQAVYMEISFLDEVHYFYEALDKGWWIAPLGAQDNHAPDWCLRPEYAMVYATELTEAGLREAFEARRFYATTDRTLELVLNGNGSPMGSRLAAESVALDIRARSTSGKTPKLVRLVASGAKTLKEWTPEGALFETTFEAAVPAGTTQWFVVYVENADGTFALSAPIIVKNAGE